jgi:hypothetical protein
VREKGERLRGLAGLCGGWVVFDGLFFRVFFRHPPQLYSETIWFMPCDGACVIGAGSVEGL